MCLQRLAVFLQTPDLLHPPFASLTHLDLLDNNDESLTQILAHIPKLPVLSHLALDPAVSQASVETVLVECPRLKLLLVLWSSLEDYESAQIQHVYDVRFVIGLCPEDYWGDWEAGATGRPHFWSLGDDFVAQKRNKLIEGTIFAIIESHLVLTFRSQRHVTGCSTLLRSRNAYFPRSGLHSFCATINT
jgi:hypothetical protein